MKAYYIYDIINNKSVSLTALTNDILIKDRELQSHINHPERPKKIENLRVFELDEFQYKQMQDFGAKVINGELIFKTLLDKQQEEDNIEQRVKRERKIQLQMRINAMKVLGLSTAQEESEMATL